jgi:hypothetical protein
MRGLIAMGAALLVLGLSRPGSANITDLLRFMRPVQAVPRTLSQSPPRKLLFNGFPITVMSGRTPESIDAVLNFYEQSFSREPHDKPTQPMQRQRGRDFGALVTVDAPLLETLQAMRATHQHYALTAPLRMAYAHRAADAVSTDYLAMWSDSALPAGVLAPPGDKDAPGMDAPETPRPPSGVRSFNLHEPASGYLVVTYDVPLPPQSALEGTLGVLRGAGYAPDPGFAAAAEQRGKRVVRLVQPGRDLIVSVRPDKKAPDACTVTYLLRNHLSGQ